jgi:hypothetical protein
VTIIAWAIIAAVVIGVVGVIWILKAAETRDMAFQRRAEDDAKYWGEP